MSESYLLPFLTIYALAYIIVLSLFILKRLEKTSIRKRAFKILSEGFNDQVPIDEADIKLICKEFRFPSYVSLIESYLLYLRDGHGSVVNDFEKVNAFLKSEIAKEHTARPYDGIEESERRIMLSIEETAHDESIKRIVKNNLNELSVSIRKNENSLRKAKTLNSWMIPLTIIGFILTVATYLGGSKLSKKDINKLDTHFSNILDQRIHPLEESIISFQIPDKIDE